VNRAGVTLFTRDDLVPRMAPVWNPVPTSMFGQVDKMLKDRVYKVALRLWGAWENLATIFPSYAMAPQAGTSIFGTTDSPLVILARNGDQITYANAQITKLAALYLGVDSELFAADVEFTAILKNSANPEDAGAYYTLLSGQTYADSAFAKTNYKRVRFSAAWGALTGFTSFSAQKGFQVAFDLDAVPVPCDGLGTVDYTVGNNIMQGTVKGIPIGPTLAQIEAQTSSQNDALGTLLSNQAADLTLTGSGMSIVAKGAAIIENGYAFGIEPLRFGEITWGTTLGFTAGVPNIVGSVS
jgi:hypothetical protein